MDESLTKIRHERSKKDFPDLDLGEGEYVEFAFRRARIRLLIILLGISLSVIIILLAFLLTLLGQSMLDEMGKNFMFIILASLLAAAVIIGHVGLMIYRGNRLFITNKRIIQRIMNSPTSHSVNIIDLSAVEDASFHQDGILAAIFHYGTLRLSTIGDETTYTFKYSDISSKDLEAVTKMISAAKKRSRHNHSDDAGNEK